MQSKNQAVKMYKGPLHGIKVILQNEGPRGLFRGIGSAVCDILLQLHIKAHQANIQVI